MSTEWPRRLKFLIKGLVSAGLVFHLLKDIHPSELWRVVRGADLRFVALCLLASVVLVGLSAQKWQVLLRSKNLRVPLRELVRLYMIGYFFNNLLPSNVGGDVVRAHELGERTGRKAESFASVFMERFTGLTVLVFFSVISFFVNRSVFRDPKFAVAVGAVLAGYGTLLGFSLRRTPHPPAGPRNAGGIAGKLEKKLRAFQSAVGAYRGEKRALLYALGNSVLFYVFAVVNVYLATLAFGGRASFGGLARIVPMVMLLMMLPISLGGIGLMEWAYVFALSSLGDPGAVGLSVGLLMRAKGLLIGLIGAGMYVLGPRKAGAEPEEARPPLTHFHDLVNDTRRSPLQKYQELVVGQRGSWALVRHELIASFFGSWPGLAGLYLRQKTFRFLFRRCGRGVVIGRNVTLRRPGQVSIGDGSMIDDDCVISVRGSDAFEIRIGKGVLVGRRSEVLTRSGSIELEDYADIGSHCRISSPGGVRIGKNVLVASFCSIGGAQHRFDRTDVPIRMQGNAETGGVVIEDDVWLGAGVIVNGGVTVGRGCVVGAGSVVTRNLPAYSVAYGVPAKVVRFRDGKKEEALPV
ncbi:MAG: flippase-like domain-containing protein [Elusimicrobia bacterium]|nr:flippase-like domain-containing protein [Elusimicrobiota bacterium]